MNRTDQMIVKFRKILDQTERIEQDELWLYQQSRLKPLLLHARSHVPFYRDRLSCVFDGDQIDFTKWREIPILNREEAVRVRSSLKAGMVPPYAGPVFEEETSGSTGRPLRFLSNDLLKVAALATTDRLYRWWGIDGSKTMVTFVAPTVDLSNPDRSVTYGWKTGFNEGSNILRASTGDFDSHIDWLCETRPDYLGIPSGMLRPLAERTRDRGLKLEFDAIMSRGGTVDQETWPLCRKVFKARLIDQYGANEVGPIACQCPHCTSYHIHSEVTLVEVLDAEGAPTSPGETGRVVLTSFNNFAMPFIRYEIGDFATVGGQDNVCKVKLPRLCRILGRYRNSFTLRDGTILFPHPQMSEFRKYFSYQQIQLIQTDYEQLEVQYVPEPGDMPADEQGLETWLQQELNADFSVRLVEVDSIPRSPSGKYEDFISLVQPGRTTGAEN